MLKENPAGMTRPTTSFEQPSRSSFSMHCGIMASDEVAANTNRISSLKYPTTRDSLKPQSLSAIPKTTTIKPRQTRIPPARTPRDRAASRRRICRPSTLWRRKLRWGGIHDHADHAEQPLRDVIQKVDQG